MVQWIPLVCLDVQDGFCFGLKDDIDYLLDFFISVCLFPKSSFFLCLLNKFCIFNLSVISTIYSATSSTSSTSTENGESHKIHKNTI